MTTPLREDDRNNRQDIASPGKRLRIARQAKGLSHSEVASHLHLSSAIIQALESDDYERLPGPVFVRGYLRNYARILGLDDKAVLSDLDQADKEHAKPAPTTATHSNVKTKARRARRVPSLFAWMLGIGLAALVGLWWQGYLKWPEETPVIIEDGEIHSAVDEDGALRLPEPDTAPEQLPSIEPITSAAALPDIDGNSLLAIRTEPLQALAPDIAQSSAPADIEESIEDSPESGRNALQAEDENQASAALSPAASNGSGVVFEFTGPCWVDIRDATRTFKLFGEMRKGDRRTLDGTPPYSVILGNAPTVRILINGQEYDVQAHARGSVARFTLDPNAIEQN
jgi:cytoskeleton protein RodZ